MRYVILGIASLFLFQASVPDAHAGSMMTLFVKVIQKVSVRMKPAGKGFIEGTFKEAGTATAAGIVIYFTTRDKGRVTTNATLIELADPRWKDFTSAKTCVILPDKSRNLCEPCDYDASAKSCTLRPEKEVEIYCDRPDSCLPRQVAEEEKRKEEEHRAAEEREKAEAERKHQIMEAAQCDSRRDASFEVDRTYVTGKLVGSGTVRVLSLPDEASKRVRVLGVDSYVKRIIDVDTIPAANGHPESGYICVGFIDPRYNRHLYGFVRSRSFVPGEPTTWERLKASFRTH